MSKKMITKIIAAFVVTAPDKIAVHIIITVTKIQ